MLPAAEELLRDAGLRDRVELVAGDFSESVRWLRARGGGADGRPHEPDRSPAP
ncbi:MAG: hypothetical protein ACTHMY_30465 [Solirubrobacteraceae bacterium]